MNAGRVRGGGGEGRGGTKYCRSILLISVGEEAFSSLRKQSGALPDAIFLVSHSNRTSMSARNCDQWTLLADWIALK